MLQGLKNFMKREWTPLANLASTLSAVLRSPFGKHGGDRDVKYSTVTADIQDDNSICDRATAFYLRVILQFNHQTVIEIGSFTGERILAVKRCLPHVTAFGLDIGPEYRKGFERGGVAFSEYGLGFFQGEYPSPLVVCHCTLNYLQPGELSELLQSLRQGGYCVAFCEPVPHFSYDVTLRRSHIAYYHAYEKVFRECGFRLGETRSLAASWHSFSTSMGEFTYMNYARILKRPFPRGSEGWEG